MKPLLFLTLLLLGVPVVHAQAPNLGFTAFANANLNDLAGGQVLQARGGLIDFERGVTAQSLFFIEAPADAVLDKLQNWNPARHSELQVWMHESLPPHPTAADFSGINSLPDNSSVNNMVNATYNYTPGSDALQLSTREGEQLAAAHGQPHSKQYIVDTWSRILADRVTAYLAGNPASAQYDSAGGGINSLNEARALLRSDPKIFGEFHPMLAGTPIYKAARTSPAQLYYESFDIEGTACFGTGAVYLARSPSTAERADIEYYVSSGIYTSLELEQLWPVTLGGRNGTLVWRSDMVSTANVAYLHGTERLASGMLMLQDVKQAVDAFRAEFR